VDVQADERLWHGRSPLGVAPLGLEMTSPTIPRAFALGYSLPPRWGEERSRIYSECGFRPVRLATTKGGRNISPGEQTR
jgi:hypothetical protein